ncbi:MAG: hypothetical protein HXY44_18015 [Syntrophaceae bacterium]|nr:hypothetical protein [Syntrophaceae bacterium]
MKDHPVIRERYLRDGLSIRIGGLAANLARVKSFSEHPDHRDIVESLLEESKFFIEWTALDAEPALQGDWVELQLRLACWQRSWGDIWVDPARRAALAEEAHAWSERLLKISGLMH